jgi:hypothetical protein
MNENTPIDKGALMKRLRDERKAMGLVKLPDVYRTPQQIALIKAFIAKLN